MKRTKNFTRLLSTLTLAASLLCGAVPAPARQRRQGARAAPPAAAPHRPAASAEGARPSPMAEAFRSGRLPEAARLPPGGVDEQAAALAKAVTAGDANSTAALYAAVLAAGFGVRDEGGAVLQTLSPGQGLVLDAWEVAALAKLSGDGAEMLLSDLASAAAVALAPAAPGADAARVSAAVLDALREHAQSGRPELRFWARFIAELGRGTARGLDLSNPRQRSEDIHLHPVQVSLILHRLGGDLFVLSQRQAGAPAARGATRRARGAGRGRVQFLKAGYAPTAAPGPQTGRPCKIDIDGTVFDLSALGITTVHGKFLDWLAGHVETGGGGDNFIEKYGKLTAAANVILAYAKLIMTYASLRTELSVEGTLPLVRTRDTRPGQKRTLTAKVYADVGKWQTANCLRWFLNVAGLDFNLPDNGPLAGVTVVWKLDQGGDDWREVAAGRESQFVGFAAQGQGVPASKTDERGVARIGIEGTPQKREKSARAEPVLKEAVVRTTVRLKAGDWKAEGADLLGQALGGVGGLITLPAELIYRTDWVSTAALSFPVRDWEECEGGWSGEIVYERVRDASRGDRVDRDEFTLTARVNEPGAHSYPGGITLMDVQAPARFTFGGRSFGPGFCNGDYAKSEASLSGDTTANVWLRIRGDVYQLSLRSGSHEAVEEREHATTNCPAAKEHRRQQVRRFTRRLVVDGAALHYEGKVDPARPNEITGSEVRQVGDSHYRIRWTLRRCR